MGKGPKRQVWGLDLNLGTMCCPQPSVFLHIKREGWAGLDEFFVSFSVYHSRSLFQRFEINPKSKVYSNRRERYHISGTCPQEIVPQTLTLLNTKTKIFTSGSCHPCHPKLKTDSVKRTETWTSA